MKKQLKISEELKELNKVMDNFSLEDVSVAIFFDVRKSKNNGYYPVKIRVTHKRIQRYYFCMDLSPQEWEILTSGKQIRKESLIKTKKLIYSSFKTITDIVEQLAPGKHFTWGELNLRLSRGTETSINDAFRNRIKTLQDEGKIGSANWYTCALNSIENYAKKTLTYAEITPAWLEKYEKQLLDEGKEYTTISINMRALRAIINQGKAKGIITERQYPFVIKKNGKYSIPEGSGRKLALSKEQLIKVFNYPLHPDEEKYRDLWIFSFYCNGANMSDVLRFKYGNIEGNYIEWIRGKTEHGKDKGKIRAVITEEMRAIIDTYGNPDTRPGNYIFNYLSPGLSPLQKSLIIKNTIHNINRKMTIIGKALDIGHLTTYAARHSWASISRHEGVSLFGISKGMGHHSLATTQIYLDSLSDDELIENAAKLPRRKI